MQRLLLFMPAMVLAGAAAAQESGRADPRDPGARAPSAEYRSAFEGYRSFAEQELVSWRKANDEVAAAGGRAGHGPGQGEGRHSSKPQPGKPESSGAQHGGHK